MTSGPLDAKPELLGDLKASRLTGAANFPLIRIFTNQFSSSLQKIKCKAVNEFYFQKQSEGAITCYLYSIHSEKKSETSYCNDKKNNAQAWLLNIF